MKAAEREKILNKMCDNIVHCIEAMILTVPLEMHGDDAVKKKAKKTCNQARKRMKEYLVEIVKCASDPDFVLKDVPNIKDEEEFKFLQVK
jgi:ribosomal 50S subunit-associated protein YjgA (DUF615 family)